MDEDKNLSMLEDMGFQDNREIRQSLRMAKNDINKAVEMLTNDEPLCKKSSRIQGGLSRPKSPKSLKSVVENMSINQPFVKITVHYFSECNILFLLKNIFMNLSAFLF